MKKMYTFFVTAFLLLIDAGILHAGAAVEITPGIGCLLGDTTYAIGNVPAELDVWGRAPYFPMSELKFPLGVLTAMLDARVSVDRVSVSGGVRKNITERAGHMRDYDWGVPDYWDPDGTDGPKQTGWWINVYDDGSKQWYMLDVESRSRTEVDFLIWHVDASYTFYSHAYDYSVRDVFRKETLKVKGEYAAYIGLGYERRSFQYECRLIEQWSPSGLPNHNALGDGTVGLTYDVDYSMPFVLIGAANYGEKFNFDMQIGYSPLVYARDKDAHLARTPPIYAEGSCKGNGYKAKARLQYKFTPHWFLQGAADYLYVRTHGEQDNTQAGYLPWTTDERITSRESLLSLSIGCLFDLPGMSAK